MAACNIPFGAVVEVILIHSVVFTPGFRADGGLMAYIRHRLNQHISTTCQQLLHTRRRALRCRYGGEKFHHKKHKGIKQ
jgi:hypothetical protein